MPIFHCYWSGKLTLHHVLCLSSLLKTQPLCGKIHFWTDESDFDALQNFLSKNGFSDDTVVPQIFDPETEMEDTPLQGYTHWLNALKATDVSHFSDAFRVLVLFKYGGIYFDLDILFLKDLAPVITEGANKHLQFDTGGDESLHACASVYRRPLRDFVYEWATDDHPNTCNTALMGVAKARGDNMVNILDKAIRISSFLPWNVFTRDEAHNQGFTVLPWKFIDPIWGLHAFTPHCTSFRDFFTGNAGKFMYNDNVDLKGAFPEAYAFHWHNSWDIRLEDHPHSLAFQFLKYYNPKSLARAIRLSHKRLHKRLTIISIIACVLLICLVSTMIFHAVVTDDWTSFEPVNLMSLA